MTAPTKAEQLRAKVAELQPVSIPLLCLELGWSNSHVRDYVGPMVKRELLRRDPDTGLLSIGREPVTVPRNKVYPSEAAQKAAARERKREQRAGQPKQDRRAEEYAKRRSDDRQPVSRKATNAAIAQHFRNKEIGIPGGIVETSNGFESVESFLARGGAIQRLQPWEVSAAARLQYVEEVA